jgi:hypothetical protein
MNGPPSCGQLTICGRSETRQVPCRIGARRRQRSGSAALAVRVTGRKAQRVLRQRDRVVLQFDQPLDPLQRVAEEEAGAVQRAEQVGDRGEPRAAHPGEEQRRPARLEDAQVDGGHLQVRVDLVVDAQQVAVALEVLDAGAQARVSHPQRPSRTESTQARTRSSSSGSGSEPAVSTASWKPPQRKRSPSSARAASRSSRIVFIPIM